MSKLLYTVSRAIHDVEIKSIGELPKYNFELLTSYDASGSLFCLRFRDPTWELPGILPAQPPPHPVEMFIDKEPKIVESDLLFLVYDTNLELMNSIEQAVTEAAINLRTTRLVRSLASRIAVYFPEYRLLQGVMRLCGAIISGSFLVSFLENKDDQMDWTPGDLDFFLQRTEGDRPLKIFLSFALQKGYTLVGETRPTYATTKTIGRSFRLVNDTNHVINVVECTGPSILATVANFHCSLVCNVLTSERILVMYPDWTDHSQALAPATIPQVIKEKYETRGFTFVHHNTDDGVPCNWSCPAFIRSVHRVGSRVCAPLSFIWRRTQDPEIPAHFEWKSSVPCTNVYCKNCAVPADLRESLIRKQQG